MKVIFEAEPCTGCRACELACSLHHQNIFRPSIASIEIKEKNGNNNRRSFEIHIYTKGNTNHLGCDKCAGLPEPLCVKYCGENSVKDELKSFLQI